MSAHLAQRCILGVLLFPSTLGSLQSKPLLVGKHRPQVVTYTTWGKRSSMKHLIRCQWRLKGCGVWYHMNTSTPIHSISCSLQWQASWDTAAITMSRLQRSSGATLRRLRQFPETATIARSKSRKILMAVNLCPPPACCWNKLTFHVEPKWLMVTIFTYCLSLGSSLLAPLTALFESLARILGTRERKAT